MNASTITTLAFAAFFSIPLPGVARVPVTPDNFVRMSAFRTMSIFLECSAPSVAMVR
jgi:hypothetical protein